MPSLSTYEQECITLDKDTEKAVWTACVSRLGREWRRIEDEKAELAKEGIYISVKEDLSEFTVMLLKEKDAGPYNFIPLIFTIKPCKNIKTGNMYPLIPPIVKFHSFNGKYIHPNFKTTGDVCISILEYSYVGGGVAQWNPSVGIKTLALTLSSLLTEGAIRNEPSYNAEPLTSQKCIDYDTGAQYLCMQYALQKLEEENPPFKDILLAKKKDILEYIISKTASRQDLHIKTYGFEVNTIYKNLQNNAIELAHNDPHSN
jgi:ubiquitin-protein ligase